MYCAGCGSEISAGLNFCKSCGMRLFSEEKSENSNRILTTLAITFGVVTVVGFGILMALIALLLDRNATEKTITMTIVFYLASLTAIEFVLGSQISKVISATVKKEKNVTPEFVQPPQQLYSRTTAQLTEPAQPPASVTDHTTRIFDKIPIKEN
ncbi:MAG: hypothetical protein LUM44_08385 [Pyrinomonadaceae bacterium]|nr:hypothetical protein [Pyrinomonadaceae bacterium]